MTRGYLVDGPGDKKWSIWDHGDELTACEGPTFADRIAARVPPSMASHLDAGGRWEHVVDAANAIHVARLLSTSLVSMTPSFRKLWRAC